MKRADLHALQGEYCESRERKVSDQHRKWSAIMDAYGMRQMEHVTELLGRHSLNDLTIAEGALAQVASLHVVSAKMTQLITLKDTQFTIESDDPMDEPIATCFEQAMGELKKLMGWNKVQRLKALWAVLTGTGITKVGYASAHVYGEGAWSDDVPKTNRWWQNHPDRHFPYGPTTEYTNPEVRPGMPTIIHVPTTDIFFNLGAKSHTDVRRIYHRMRRPLVDVIHDARYRKQARALAHEHLVTSRENQSFLSLPWMVYAEDVLYAEVIECFDLASRQFCVFMEGVDEPLRDWTLFPLPIENPYNFYQPDPDPEYVWAQPYALRIFGQAAAMNFLRGLVVDRIARDGKTVNLWDASIDPQTQNEIMNAVDGGHVFMQGLNNLLTEGKPPFYQLKFGDSNADLLKLMSIFERDQAWSSGLSDPARNQSVSGDVTATEASIRSQEQGLTIEEFVTLNEEDQGDAMSKVCRIALAMWPESRMVKVTGPTPEIYFWVPLERARLLRDFKLRVVAGSSLRQDAAVRRSQWEALLPRLAEWMQMAELEQQKLMQGLPPGPVNVMAVIRKTLDMYDTTWKYEVLNQVNFGEVLLRLVMQHRIYPTQISPQLAMQVRAMVGQSVQEMQMLEGEEGATGGGMAVGAVLDQAEGGRGRVPGEVVSFEERRRVQGVAPMVGAGVRRPFGTQGGEVTGRLMSEAVG